MLLACLPEVDDISGPSVLLVRVLDHVGVSAKEHAVGGLIHWDLKKNTCISGWCIA